MSNEERKGHLRSAKAGRTKKCIQVQNDK